MDQNVRKFLSVFIYGCVFILAPLFHLHPEEDHWHVSGEIYHSHSLPTETVPLDHETPELPHGEELKLYHLLPTFARTYQFAAVTLPDLTIFLQWQYLADISPYKAINTHQQKRILDTILSPQWDNYILYAANISPPLA